MYMLTAVSSKHVYLNVDQLHYWVAPLCFTVFRDNGRGKFLVITNKRLIEKANTKDPQDI